MNLGSFLALDAGVIILIVLGSILLLGGGLVIGVFIIRSRLIKAGKSAESIIEEAKKVSDEQRKMMVLEAKQEIHRLKQEFDKETRQLKQETEKEIKERKQTINEMENKLNQREERFERRFDNLNHREESLIQKELKIEQTKTNLEKQTSKMEEIIQEQNQRLLEISGLSVEQAKKIIIERVEDDMTTEISNIIREGEEKAKSEVDKKAKELLATVIQSYASDVVAEKTVSVVVLPNDEMKGRIIGREGRNIRAIEASTGVDLIIDDTPEAVVVSCFDPIRREIARRTLEALVSDGRIQPTRVEELVLKFQKEMESELREAGEKAVFETGIGKVHPELIKILGRLKFRTSYGQNALAHSIEVAFLSGKLAVEIGEDEILARRAGLLHDIGKAIDAEMEGSHIDIGIQIATRYREKPEVLDAIASHHGDQEAKTIIAQLVAAADTLSAARPGARRESLETYIKRLTQLEELCNEFKGVDKTYALQAGREIRVLVKPEEINDAQSYKLARDIKTKIENSLTYPGTIKVTIIRETRVSEVAK
ncbi:MAG: ribonuclease Y [Bacilli bacterium]|nr:ribonuclease Y [Bacilli bacterium]